MGFRAWPCPGDYSKDFSGLHPRSAFIFHWTKQIAFLLASSCLRTKSQQLTSKTDILRLGCHLTAGCFQHMAAFSPPCGSAAGGITSFINYSGSLLNQGWDSTDSYHSEYSHSHQGKVFLVFYESNRCRNLVCSISTSKWMTDRGRIEWEKV